MPRASTLRQDVTGRSSFKVLHESTPEWLKAEHRTGDGLGCCRRAASSGRTSPAVAGPSRIADERAAATAQAAGELDASSDPQQLAFELEAALLSANWYYHLYHDPAYLERARRAVRDRLASQATRTGLHSLPPE